MSDKPVVSVPLSRHPCPSPRQVAAENALQPSYCPTVGQTDGKQSLGDTVSAQGKELEALEMKYPSLTT